MFKCAACGTIKPVDGREYNAGHLFSVASSKSLRFDERNVHGICARCNKYDENHVLHLAEYVKKKLGENVYNTLYMKSKGPVPKYMRFELIEMIEKYKKKCKEIEKGKS